ncbi:hypothetical protein A2V82_12755 [candidate division KSB1 bacterium RBG_16_48_16]|nr:MAG: hypothetical protein A2V82_12755 [candidate division KSB1 bacterium RBG_16_48_16]
MKKKAKKFFVVFYYSISFKLFVVLLLIIILLYGLYSAIYYKLQNQVYEDTIGLAAYRTSDVAKKSLHRLMLLNERDELYNTIQVMGSEPGIESISIFNKKGVIKFSTKNSEIGHVVNMKAEACYGCHAANEPITSLPIKEKKRIYRTEDGRRIMGLINPIHNAPACSNSNCHAHDPEQTILGVLDVKMSLAELDQARLRTRIIVYTLSFGLILFAMFLLAVVVFLVIYRPIRTLQTGMLKLSVGDLDYRIKMDRKDELGMLANSFNNMARNLKGAYNRMLQVEKMASLGKMAATVAHELNNPLAGIASYAKLLQRRTLKKLQDGEENNHIQKDLSLILSETLRCGNIVRNLLEFAHGESAKFQEIKLKEIIDKALGIVGHHIELAKVEAESHVKIHPEKITCDPDQLLQAFVALLVNAVEAMPQGGQLRINAQNSDNEKDHVLIEISDTGYGIREEFHIKIFEPFFTTKKDKTGIGLGLAVVYGIIQRHKGKIWFESREKSGTTFFIELPVTQHQKK